MIVIGECCININFKRSEKLNLTFRQNIFFLIKVDKRQTMRNLALNFQT